jgi:nucleotide-binding universal stress UspA family protein
MSRPVVVGLSLRPDDAAPLSLARFLADLAGAPLALATAFPYDTVVPTTTPDYARELTAGAHKRLEELAVPLRRERDVNVTVRQGSRSAVLHDLATEIEALAIVVGSSHRGAAGRTLAGDVAAGLLHGAPCPVVVAPRGYSVPAAGPERIGVGFTDTPEGRIALQAAAGLAAATGAALEVIAVVEPQDYTAAYGVPGWVPQQFDPRELFAERARAAIDAAASELAPDVAFTTETPRGRAVEQLARASARLDLLVCGSRGYGALRGAIAGSVSRGLAHRAHCPLVLVPRNAATLTAPFARTHVEAGAR